LNEWHLVFILVLLENNKPQKEYVHLEKDTEDDKGPLILFCEFEAALGELKMERQKERM